jgi:hypothetical protein
MPLQSLMIPLGMPEKERGWCMGQKGEISGNEYGMTCQKERTQRWEEERKNRKLTGPIGTESLIKNMLCMENNALHRLHIGKFVHLD